MKTKTKTTFLFVALLFVINSAMANDKTKQSYKKTVTFHVSMDCESCKRSIEKNIAFESGVKDMNVELKSKEVTVTFDSRKTDEAKLIESFRKLGYEARVLRAGK